MTAATHPLAPHGLPSFIGGADGSDPLFTAVVFILIAGLMGVAVLYFKLHSIPEHLAQKQNNGQTELIMVLAILALFTHNNLFWVAALVLALVKFPDFTSPLNSIAQSLRIMTETEQEPEPEPEPEISASTTNEQEQ
jgi:hypothetical protein|tara:strand:+ start:1145 stop:1555 length:411 start_codon:yes stop_codon:yes gene_type:complete